MSEQPTLRVGRAAVEAARAEVAALEAAGKANEVDPMVRRIAQAQVATPTPVQSEATVGVPTAELELPAGVRLIVRDSDMGLTYVKGPAGRRLKKMFRARDKIVRGVQPHTAVVYTVKEKGVTRPAVVEIPVLSPRPDRRFVTDRKLTAAREQSIEREMPF